MTITENTSKIKKRAVRARENPSVRSPPVDRLFDDTLIVYKNDVGDNENVPRASFSSRDFANAYRNRRGRTEPTKA